MHLRRGGLDSDGLGRAAGGRGLGLSLLLHGVVVRHATVGHLGLTLRHDTFKSHKTLLSTQADSPLAV